MLAWLIFHLEGKAQIWPVKAAQKSLWGLAIKEPRDNLGTGFGIRCRGKGGKRHIKAAPERANFQIIRPKVMAPLADTMGLIHGNQADIRFCQYPLHPARGQAFWRDIEKFQFAFGQTVPDRIGFFGRIA